MYCPECGNEVEPDASFCTRCGRVLTASSPTFSETGPGYTATPVETYTFRPAPVRRRVHLAPVLVLVVVAIVVGAALLLPGQGPTGDDILSGKEFRSEPYAGSAVDTDDSRMVLPIEGFDDGKATLCFVDNERPEEYKLSKCPRLILSKNISDRFTTYSWVVEGIGTIEKEEPFVTVYTTSVEEIRITVTCSGGSCPDETYSFRYAISLGNAFEWKYLGGTFSLQKAVPLDSVRPYVPATDAEKKLRAVSDWSLSRDFVVVESVISSLAEDLRGLYRESLGEPSNDQSFADFVLAFVQCSFRYVSDTEGYGQSEYYAYPLETLVNGFGDCEDTSIICAALWKALGYDVALVLLPQHMAAAVSLAEFKEPTGYRAELVKDTLGDRTFYAGETTVDRHQPLGLLSEDTGYAKLRNKGVMGAGSYGFYEVDP
ncbi:MAG: zinc-ribbon domain-containing protein [archaeon]|nr:zinc-ribbon domain-containing protein [archaeon]